MALGEGCAGSSAASSKPDPASAARGPSGSGRAGPRRCCWSSTRIMREPGSGAVTTQSNSSFSACSFDLIQSDGIDLAAAVDHYACFILNRVEWSDEVAALADRARSRDAPVIFETDDLIFEPELSRYFAFLQGWSEQGRQPEIEKLRPLPEDSSKSTARLSARSRSRTTPASERQALASSSTRLARRWFVWRTKLSRVRPAQAREAAR